MTMAMMRFVVATVLIALPIWSAPSDMVLTVSSFNNRGGISLHMLALYDPQFEIGRESSETVLF